jgi:glutamate/tyrosine decarboxylase-like PLP-dependent enzyme
MANLTGLAVGRQEKLGDDVADAVAYIGDQCHSSVARALRVLGIKPENIRAVGSDADFRLSMDSLKSALAEDRAAGRRPFCVVANAGTTNTGAVDPLPQIAEFCRSENLWFHIDGAYGAPAILAEKGKALLGGLELADSLSLDPHKWLFQSFEAGCVLVRDRAALLRTFQVMPEYLRDTEGVSDEINFGNYGVQLTRSFRALKLWLSLRVFGLASFRNAIARGIEIAEVAQRELERTDGWEIVTPARLAVVTFRFAPPSLSESKVDVLQGGMVEAMLKDGYALATSTVLAGRPALRLCTINPRTTDEEIVETVRWMTEIGNRLATS